MKMTFLLFGLGLPKAVAYIVFSARDEASYRKNFPALNEVLKSFAYMKVEGDHKQP
jgi:hypothetical protein